MTNVSYEYPEDGEVAFFLDAYQGSRGPQQEAIAQAGLAIVALLLRKNTDYGSSVFDAPMLAPELPAAAAIKVRMSDKLKRIIRLASHPEQVKGENLLDSLDDLCGYRILERAASLLQKDEGTLHVRAEKMQHPVTP